ncbi:preprotein translocase subunit SecG [Clostridium sp. Cult1]|jgi:preprotein translocase subunit SecG|uniref:preprotein translocase subunit SecG n=1 Tax=Clostridium sp. Cult1 TaxID=2079002 RepID=UPI001F00AED3|nr:preprotein translocase subunit SecG [Clostridium sp. Cult1]MCF6462500.1 preprotein translocase subunit SecG [Clostridium sp. Cult1]
MTIFFSIIFLISSISLIVSVLLQESKSEGLGALTGGGQNLFGKSRLRTFEAMLSRITTVSAVVFMISALVLAVI